MESTKVCMKCGKEIPAEFIFCPFCGADQTKNICKKCGAALLDGAVYCGACGAKIESEAPVQGVQAESFVTPETENEEVVCTPVQAENIAAYPVASTAEKVETSGDLPSSKHQNKRGVFDKNKALSIAKSTIILVFCIIMFGLAFGPTAKISLSFYDEISTSGKTRINYLSTVDGIKLMNATARHYKEDRDNIKIEKIERELDKSYDELIEKIEKCYSEKQDKYTLDSNAAKALGEFTIDTQSYFLSFDKASGSTASNNAIVLGLTSLLYILFASSMLICAIIYFVFTLTGKGKDIGKFVYALPMFLFFALALSFISGVFNENTNTIDLEYFDGEASISGTMIVTMLFSIMSMVAILAVDTMKKIKNGYSLKKQVFKVLPIALILIVCACVFAPSAKSTLSATTETKSEKFTFDYYTDFTMSSVLSKGEKESRKEFFAGKTREDEFDFYMKRIEKNNTNFVEYLSKPETQYSRKMRYDYARMYSADDIEAGLLAQAQPDATAALAFGYYACYIVILLSGAWVCAYLSDTEKYKATSKALQAAVGILVIIALALTIVTICVVNATMQTAEIMYFSMSVGGGLIAALVMFVAFTIAAGLISGRFKDAPKIENPIEREAA